MTDPKPVTIIFRIVLHYESVAADNERLKHHQILHIEAGNAGEAVSLAMTGIEDGLFISDIRLSAEISHKHVSIKR